MPFTTIRGQDNAVRTLTHALRSGRVHHAYRFEGPDGVGKELAAFALAQALVCTAGDPLGCGICSACKRAVTFAERPKTPLHPDVVVIEKGLYPPETIGRSRPELSEISIDQVRRIVLEHASYAPHEGKAKIFIVRRADELSIGAANALLKTLEEPRKNTHFVLITSRGERLLPTIQSRSLPLRFAPLSQAILRDLLTARGVSEHARDLAVELAAGSATAAIESCDDELTARRDEFIRTVMNAVQARDLGPTVAIGEAKDRDKFELRTDLRALGAALAREARNEVAEAPDRARVAAARYDAVARAIQNLEKNASPSLTMLALLSEMREVAT